MTHGHWFWWALTAACVVWYSSVTIYVAIRGFYDIRGMLKRLAERQTMSDSEEQT